jgi:CubicO group peptidase (beta-lactamase class C family)
MKARRTFVLPTVVTLAVLTLAAGAAPLHARAVADSPAGWSEAIPTARPEEVGLSSERLARIAPVMERHVAEGRMAGAVGAVARRGKLAYLETWGFQDREAGTPMGEESIFRIFSMSKAITGVALMMLHEEQGFPLTTAASRWLPELGGLEVAVEAVDPATGERSYRLEPAKRDMSIVDLLSHSSGLSYQGPRDARGELIYKKLGIDASRGDLTLADLVRRIGEAPLHEHPGTVWRYGLSTDVAGRLVEAISGSPFDQFLEERIFQPLRMRDTAFWVPAEKKARLTAIYSPAGDDGKLKPYADPPRDYLSKPKLLSGGGGLVSTTRDYLRFVQMLLDGGQLGGRRLLSPKSVELMASDHIGDMPRGGNLGPGDGFGLTFRVNQSPGRNGALGSIGEFSWGGAAGTRFWIDPEEEMVTLFMIQILPQEGLTFGSEFKALAYQAIVD